MMHCMCYDILLYIISPGPQRCIFPTAVMHNSFLLGTSIVHPKVSCVLFWIINCISLTVIVLPTSLNVCLNNKLGFEYEMDLILTWFG